VATETQVMQIGQLVTDWLGTRDWLLGPVYFLFG